MCPVALFAAIGELANPSSTITPSGGIRITVSVRNPGSQTTSYKLTAGMLVGGADAQTGISISLSPGQTQTYNLDLSPSHAGILAWPAGTYDMYVDLHILPGGALADSKSLKGEIIVQTPAPQPTGPLALFSAVYVYHPTVGYWQQVTSSEFRLPSGYFYLGIAWMNKSTAAVSGHVKLEVTASDGYHDITDLWYSGQDQAAEPNNGKMVGFGPIGISSGDRYDFTASLLVNGALQDTLKFTFLGS